MYLNYSKIEKKAKEKYRKQMKFSRYWNNVEKRFSKLSNKDSFSMDFKHNINSDDIVYDNERLITEIATFYGFKIIDEKILSNKTIFKFKKV